MVNKRATDSSLEKINDAVLTQSIFGRMFGFGDLDVLTAAEAGIERFRMIIDPIGFKRAMLDAKHEYEVDMERSGWQPSPPIRAATRRRAARLRAACRRAAPATGAGAAPVPPVARPRRRHARRRSAPTARRRPAPRPPAPNAAPAPTTAQPGRGHPDAGQPGRPARSRRDLAEEYEAKKADLLGAPLSPAAPSRTSRQRRARLPYAGPPLPGAAWISNDSLPAAIVVAIMLLVGFPVHEFSHALAAYRLGDGTAKLFGRLTLNPIAHFDPLGGVLLAVTFIGSAASGSAFGFGWAKPTPVNPMNLQCGRRGEAIVAAAGPHLEPRARRRRAPSRCATSIANRELAAQIPMLGHVLDLFVFINIVLMVFNLIPIPPLDGSKVLFAFLDRRTEYQIRPDPRAVRLPDPARAVLPPARRLDRRPAALPDPRCDLQLPGGRLGSASSGRTCGPAWRPQERAALATWITPAQLALFDSMHVADRRHGLDVVASLRGERRRPEPDVLLAGLLHDAGKGDTGVWPRVAYALASVVRTVGARRRPAAAGVRAGAGAAPHARRRPPPSSRRRPAARPGRWT